MIILGLCDEFTSVLKKEEGVFIFMYSTGKTYYEKKTLKQTLNSKHHSWF